MDVFTLFIAIVALVIAILAFQRTGGINDLRQQMEDLSAKSEYATKGARDMTADALSRLETGIRGQQKPSAPEEESSTLETLNKKIKWQIRPRARWISEASGRFKKVCPARPPIAWRIPKGATYCLAHHER